jgi:hypothetical protein
MSEKKIQGHAPRQRTLRQKQAGLGTLFATPPVHGHDTVAFTRGWKSPTNAMNNTEDASEDNDPQEMAGSGPDLSTLSNEGLKAYLQTFAGQIRRNMMVANGSDVMINLVQSEDKFGFRVVDTKTDDSIFIHLNLPADIGSEKHTRLVQEANRLKKAWLMAVAIMGKSKLSITNDAELALPDYWQQDSKSLKNKINDLNDAIEAAAKLLLLQSNPRELGTTISWLAAHYDEWDEAQAAIFSLGHVGEVEQHIGLLGHWRHMDCPPYAEIVLHGYEGAGIRLL